MFCSRTIPNIATMFSLRSSMDTAFFLLIAALACTTCGYCSIFSRPSGPPATRLAPKACPLYGAKAGFDVQKVHSKLKDYFSSDNLCLFGHFMYIHNSNIFVQILQFLGDWYVLEYVYNKPMRMKDLSCVGFHFSLTSFGEMQSNFTFRFPALTGHFYHVPTFSVINPANEAVWDTQFRGGMSNFRKLHDKLK